MKLGNYFTLHLYTHNCALGLPFPSHIFLDPYILYYHFVYFRKFFSTLSKNSCVVPMYLPVIPYSIFSSYVDSTLHLSITAPKLSPAMLKIKNTIINKLHIERPREFRGPLEYSHIVHSTVKIIEANINDPI